MKNDKNLQILYLSRNNFSLDDVKLLFETLSQNKSLKKLYMENCGLTNERVEIMCKYDTALEILNLKDNCITKNNIQNYIKNKCSKTIL